MALCAKLGETCQAQGLEKASISGILSTVRSRALAISAMETLISHSNV